MDVKQQILVELDSCQKKADDIGALLALSGTPEQKKKPRSVGFYELDILKPSERDEAKEEANGVKSMDLKDKDVLSQDKDATNGCSDKPEGDPSPGEDDPCPNYFDQSLLTSPGHRKHSNQTCLCKECVENYMNLCEDAVDLEETDNRSADRASLNSNKSLDGFEASRQTDSSEDDKEELMGTRFEDSEVTLPYPDKSRPPECITRLSNAGLYEPSEETSEKRSDEEDKEKMASVAFFVEHPPLEKQSQSALNKEPLDCSVKVEIEKTDPELEPLVRVPRRTVEMEPVYPALCRCHGACLKTIGSFVVAMLVFPAFLYGAYAWLPFDAPIMADIPTRLVYTLRCAAFGSVPIIMGVVIHGISRLCVSSFDPFKPREREVTIHRRFVKQSTFLFVLYFFNLCVLVTYLPQGQLKFIPLLTCLFCLAQLVYWLSFAVGWSFRGFGYGLTFLPLVSMLICNLYFMFVVEPERMMFLGGRDTNKH